MKFILGVLVGVGAAWLYRAWGHEHVPFSETIANVASTTAPHITQIIDQTPIPPHAEDVASAAPNLAEQPTEVASPVAAAGPKARTRTRRASARPSGDPAPEADQTV